MSEETEWAHVGRDLLRGELERVNDETGDALTGAAARIEEKGELSENEACHLHLASDHMTDVVDMVERVAGECDPVG